MPKRVNGAFDAHDMFRRADSFAHAAGILPGPPEAHIMHIVMFAAIVCEAFANEAYLKVLFKLTDSRKPLQTHNLLHLFFDLNADLRMRIETVWCGRQMSILERCRLHYPPNANVPQTFRQALEISGTAFVDWRYAPRFSGWWLGGLREVTREIIVELRPAWKIAADASAVSFNLPAIAQHSDIPT